MRGIKHPMKRLITNDRERVCRWAAARILREDVNFDRASAIGLEDDGKLVAAAVFTHYAPPNIAGHIVSDGSRRWMSKAFLFAMFDYPFRQLKCARITAPISEMNPSAIRFVERLGFVYEGRLRKAMLDGSDRLIYGLLKEECRYVAQ